MEFTEVSTMIGTVGFPIVAFLLMFYKLMPAIDGVKDALNNNTMLIKILLEKEGVKRD